MRTLTKPAEHPAALRRYLDATLRQLGPSRRDAAPEPSGLAPFAYAVWIDYLVFLDALVAQLDLRPDEIFPEERRGLELLREAREEFWRRHAVCDGCGALLQRGGTCALCSLQFARRHRIPRR